MSLSRLIISRKRLNQSALNVIIIILHRFLSILKTTQIAQSDVELDGYMVITVIGEGRGGLIPKTAKMYVYVDIAGVCLHLPSRA